MGDGLVERADDVAAIDCLLDAVTLADSSLLLITGPAGIGKTALLRHGIASARRRGLRVLTARGGELEEQFAFGVARQLFEPLLAGAAEHERQALLDGAAALARVVLHDASVEPALGSDASFAVIHSLYWLAVNAALMSATVLVVDDLQWADQASLHWVQYLADRLARLPLALILSWRGGESDVKDEGVDRLERVSGARHLVPKPLSAAGTRALLTAGLAQAPGERFSDACHAATGGNPFLLSELIATLRAERIEPLDHSAERVRHAGPRNVARAVTARIASSTRAGRPLSQALAILGDNAPLRYAATLAGISLDDAAHAADRLADIGILERGTPLRFVHAIVREAVYQDTPAAQRSLQHARAASLLAAGGADIDEVCAHLCHSEPVGSPEVVQQLRSAAGRASARGSPESAVTYLLRALQETVNREARTAVLHDLGRAEMLVAAPKAVAHLEEAVAIAADPVDHAAIAVDLADAYIYGGRWDAALAVLESARQGLLAVAPDGRGHRFDEIFARLEISEAAKRAYDTRGISDLDARLNTLVVAAARSDPMSTLLAAKLSGVLAFRGESIDVVRSFVERATADVSVVDSLQTDLSIVTQLMAATLFIDDVERSTELIDGVLATSRARSSLPGLMTALAYRMAQRTRGGDLTGAETDMRTVRDIADEHGLPFFMPSVLWMGLDAMIERTELTDVAAEALALEIRPDLARTLSGGFLHEVRGRLALSQGNAAQAIIDLEANAEICDALHIHNPNASPWRSALALALPAEESTRALALVESELADARRLGFPRPQSCALRALGALEGGERGIRHLIEAADVLEGSCARLEQARALVELGAALRRANRRTAARLPLRRGLDLAHRCGAGRLAERARAELLATGARPRRPVLTGLEALTPRERRVAELAASGTSNPGIAQALYVTLNTVDSHLSHVYDKLEIHSRRHLAAALTQPAPSSSTRTR